MPLFYLNTCLELSGSTSCTELTLPMHSRMSTKHTRTRQLGKFDVSAIYKPAKGDANDEKIHILFIMQT